MTRRLGLALCGVLVATGVGEAQAPVPPPWACMVNGPPVPGTKPVPPLAGRSPSYTARQLLDIQQGVQKAPWSALMKAAVEDLTVDDIVVISVVTASREP